MQDFAILNSKKVYACANFGADTTGTVKPDTKHNQLYCTRKRKMALLCLFKLSLTWQS